MLVPTMMSPAHGFGGALRASADAGELDREAKDRMLMALRAGGPGAPLRLQLDAVVYTQGISSNLKYVRLKPQALKQYVETAAGSPFLRDHEQENLLARAGSVVAARLGQRDGIQAIMQTLELVTPWAMEAALSGTLDRFSIAWTSKEGASCSICEKSMMDAGCSHWPGDMYALADGRQQICEMVFSDAIAKETSAVTVPAAANTGIEAFRAALSAARTPPAQRSHPALQPKGVSMYEKIRTAMGLAAGDETINEERLAIDIASLRRQATETKAMLAASHDELSATKKALTKVEGELTELQQVGLATRVDSLVERALAEGRILPGRGPKGERLDADKKAFPGSGERAIRQLAAAAGFEAAETWVEALESRVPSSTDIDPPRSKKAGIGSAKTLSTIQRSVNEQLGISDEDFKKFAPKKGQSLRSVEVDDDDDDEPGKDAVIAAGKE